ncbi:MAG: Hsp20/alpha crystallin family protein [Chloroflexi bacterium]|nr:Hsp20/alpha crystallin family protein [Chloroflexota bacterium]
MAQITRWDPFREMMTLRSALDRLFEEPLALSRAFTPGHWGLALDIAETDEEYIVKASIPGVKAESLDITLSDNVLTIQGEFGREETIEKAKYHLRERMSGRFSRSVTLPTAVNADAVDAVYENGVLTLRIPKAEEVKPRHIRVHAPKVIEGESSVTA